MEKLVILLCIVPIAIAYVVLKKIFPNSRLLQTVAAVAFIVAGAAAVVQIVPDGILDQVKLRDDDGDDEVLESSVSVTPPWPGNNPESGGERENEPGSTNGEAPPPTLASTPASPRPGDFPLLDYYSELSEPDKTWPTLKGQDGRAGFDGIGYTIRAERRGGDNFVLRETTHYQNFALQVDVTPLTPADATTFAVGFGWAEDDPGYLFMVQGNSRCALVRYDDPGPHTVAEEACAALRPNVASRLLLIVEGDRLQAIIDGVSILKADVDSDRGSRIGLAVFPLRQGVAAEARFNNLGIWLPPH